jgi:hypothetical protein
MLVALKPVKKMLVGCQDGSVIRPDGSRYWPGRPERHPLRIVNITEKEYLGERERNVLKLIHAQRLRVGSGVS